ncbi:dehydrogenase [Desulfuribacillus stibiiarsenatis]|uniref:Dehydrogenase n=1 Tax=Desulfuribacillus stibiiarsenatis TaxID=1390249 RepID=A0A1E5L917_9FIRM|nr:molybdopterin-dependent oxidoreductase [Desulfuribacillus stibiiarsenatis]OEH86640.1 dehydrogenase [Desulfuribacillus stibiiarsenatis]
MSLTRRGFLKVSALTGVSVLGLVGCELEEAQLDTVTETPAGRKLEPIGALKQGKWVGTGCQGCTSWCSSQAYVVDGRVIKIRGNVNAKSQQGAACPRMRLAIQQAYDPDRIKQPMKRTNPKKGRSEEPKFVPISWDEAFDTIADKLLELIKANEGHKLVAFRGRYTDINDLAYSTFPKLMGSPNNISHSSICAESEKFGPMYTHGKGSYRDYDLINSKYVLIWGMDPLATNRQVSTWLKNWGEIIGDAKIAVVEPRFTSTASKADEWLPVISGQDGALAVALAHVLLTKGLWSKEFVGDFKDGKNLFVAGKTVDEAAFTEKHTNGIVKWWNLELKDRTPEWASPLCGIPVEQIVRVATEMGNNAPYTCVMMGGGGVMQQRGAYNSMAIHALNGIVGSVEHEGGCGFPSGATYGSFPAFAEFQTKEAAATAKHKKIDHRGRLEWANMPTGSVGGGVNTNRVADGILAADPNEIKMAIGYWINLNFSCAENHRWDAAMAKVPFFAHCVTHNSEMSWFADILLPSTHHMFEQWSVTGTYQNMVAHRAIQQPMIDKVYDAKNYESEVMWGIAEKLAAKGFTNFLDYLKTFKDPETGKAATNGEELGLYMTKILTEPIWNPEKYKSGDKFNGWNHFVEVGVWNGGAFKYKAAWSNMGTATKKFEFYSETLKKNLQTHADNNKATIDQALAAMNYTARGDLAFVPHYETPITVGDANKYPLIFIDQKSRLNREGRSANCGWYQDFKDVDFGDEKNGDTIKINPVDATKLGIKHGDKVRVTSPAGSIEVTAFVWEGIRPGHAAKSYGQGHWNYGKKANGKGGNNNAVLSAVYEKLSGATVYYANTRVNITKA